MNYQKFQRQTDTYRAVRQAMQALISTDGDPRNFVTRRAIRDIRGEIGVRMLKLEDLKFRHVASFERDSHANLDDWVGVKLPQEFEVLKSCTGLLLAVYANGKTREQETTCDMSGAECRGEALAKLFEDTALHGYQDTDIVYVVKAEVERETLIETCLGQTLDVIKRHRRFSVEVLTRNPAITRDDLVNEATLIELAYREEIDYDPYEDREIHGYHTR